MIQIMYYDLHINNSLSRNVIPRKFKVFTVSFRKTRDKVILPVAVTIFVKNHEIQSDMSPSSHSWGYYHGTLWYSQVTVPHLREPDLQMSCRCLTTGQDTSEQGKSEGFDSCDRPSNLKLDSNRQFFRPCDREIWWMTLQNNRAPLPRYFKLCA